MEGLTQAQKVTRLEWMIGELKKSEILPDEVKIDCRMIAMKAADHVSIKLQPSRRKKRALKPVS